MTTSFSEYLNAIRIELPLAKGVRIKSIIFLFRLASYVVSREGCLRYLLLPIALFYKLYSEFLLGIELPAGTKISLGLRLYHGVGLVVHKDVRIGKNCVLRHGVTLGNSGAGQKASSTPIIGDNVEFGAGAIVIGAVIIGDNAVIGAGTVVTKNVPPNSIVVGAANRYTVKENV